MNVLKKYFEDMNYYKETYGVNLTSKQYKVIKRLSPYMSFRFERGEGCTTACLIKAMELAIKNTKARIAIFNNSLYSASYQFNNACKIIEHNKISSNVFKKYKTRNTHEIEFNNGSKINFLGKPIENMRGARLDFAIIDGDRYFNEEQLKMIKLLASKGSVISMDQNDILE